MLTIHETDSTGKDEFDMTPELFASYLASLLVFARDIEDVSLGNSRYIGFIDDNPNVNVARGFVSLLVLAN